MNINQFWNEPDYFKSCAFGLPFLLRRNWTKAWCGYVGVPPSHPLFGKGIENDISVHGGLTWAANHAAGEYNDGYWYFGFDTSHFNDLSPRDLVLKTDNWFETRVYRDFSYVDYEVRHLAMQLAELS